MAEETRSIADIRADVRLLDQSVAQLERDLAIAEREERSFTEQRGQLTEQITALCTAYGARTVESDAGCAVVGGDPPPEGVQRIKELAAWRRDLIAQREQWLSAHSVRATDDHGWPITKSLTPADVTRRLALCQRARDGVRSDLAQAEAAAQRELAAAAEPQPDVTSRLAAIRARLGI